MTIINQLTFFSLLCITAFFISGNWRVETNMLNEKPVIAVVQPKLNNTQSSGVRGNVSASLQDKKGRLWFVTTGNGIYRYDASLPDGQGKPFTNFTTKDGLNSDAIFSMVEDKKGNFWFGTDAGVAHYDGKTFTDIPIPAKFVTSILEDKSGKLWFASRGGVYWYDGKAFTRFLDDQSVSNPNGLALRVVQDMLEDKHGNIWFTTKDEGVCRYNGKSIISYKPNDELWFRALLEDRDGNIWVGGRETGISRYDGKTFSHILQNGRLDSSAVYSILQGKSGNIWVGTESIDPSKRETEGGVWVYDGISFKNFLKKDGLSDNAVWCILEDKSGKLWFGTRRGISQYDGKAFTSFRQ